MFFNTLRAEWTKLRTTKSFWWTTGITLVAGWVWAAIIGNWTEDTMASAQMLMFAPEQALSLLLVIGLPTLMIQAIMIVTTEYRYGIQTNTYMANPNRIMVAVAKLLLYAVISAVVIAIGVAGCYVIMDMFLGDFTSQVFDPFGTDKGRRLLWMYPLAMALLSMFGQGLGLLLRQTAGTVAIALILYLGIDGLISMIPKIGSDIVHFAPFYAFNNWLTGIDPTDAPWDSASVYGLVFVFWALGLWVLGLFTLQKRDI